MTIAQLFSGFNTLKAITFSFDVSFINEIANNFDYMEIILGADFLVEKNEQLNELFLSNLLAEVECINPDNYIVHGPNRITALPMEVPVCYQEIAHCIDKTVAKIENAVLSALENTPPELYADIVKNGIWLTGGGALLRGLDHRLQDKINIPFHIAEDPLHSVAKGAGVALKNVDRFSFLMR